MERDGIPRLERVFRFVNFAEALAFTNRVGVLAEAEGHHPALITEWGRGEGDLVDPQDSRPPPQ